MKIFLVSSRMNIIFHQRINRQKTNIPGYMLKLSRHFQADAFYFIFNLVFRRRNNHFGAQSINGITNKE